MPEREQAMREVDRRYIKFKMKRIKRAKKRGNNAEAERHATELIQMLGLNDDTDMPIEAILASVEGNIEGIEEHIRMQMVRKGIQNNWFN